MDQVRLGAILDEIALQVTGIGPVPSFWDEEHFAHRRGRYAGDARLIAECSPDRDLLEIGALPCHMSLPPGRNPETIQTSSRVEDCPACCC